MDCPRDTVEMVELSEGEEKLLSRCGECGGLWLDVADLNRLLLHADLPTLDAMGGRADPDLDAGECPACAVSLLAVASSHKRDPFVYETCESCGGIWLEGADFATEGETAPELKAGIVSFYKEYSARPQSKTGR